MKGNRAEISASFDYNYAGGSRSPSPPLSYPLMRNVGIADSTQRYFTNVVIFMSYVNINRTVRARDRSYKSAGEKVFVFDPVIGSRTILQLSSCVIASRK